MQVGRAHSKSTLEVLVLRVGTCNLETSCPGPIVASVIFIAVEFA